MDRLYQFFSEKFYTPHGFCLLWLPEVVWLHVISDALIALSYFTIPMALWYFSRKRPDMPFNRILLLFATFITLCGLTHLIGILVLWHPFYGIEGLVMLLTGIISATTAVFIWRAMPAAITIPSPAKLQEINRRLSNSYLETEKTVSERTKELEDANRQLTLEKTKADHANQAKTDFLANMSHEIRTPMNAVMGIANILEMDVDPDSKKFELINTLKLSAGALLTLIDDLLDISKIETENVRLEETEFSLTGIIDEAMKILKIKEKEKRTGTAVDFRFEKHSENTGGLMFIGDSAKLRQIIINLCSNALKFTERGEVVIGLHLADTDNPDIKNISITVTDTGIGIPQDKLDLIFEKFVQGDSSITRKYGGSGLGLAITKTLVTMMHGTLDVKSTVGSGSEFRFSLPLKLASPISLQAREETADQNESDAKKSTKGKEFIVLLVEDHSPNVLVATTFIEQFGYKWELATTGIEAVEMAREKNYGVILMDIQMPIMSGLEATNQIRINEMKKLGVRTPIIGMTAHALAGDRERCLQAGMDDYISKPFDPQNLKAKIDRFRNMVVSA